MRELESIMRELGSIIRELESIIRELGWTWVYIPIFNQKKDP